jgi:Lipopolysaccharide kinase (Kdo/WaaP) family
MRCAHVQVVNPTQETSFTAQNSASIDSLGFASMPSEREGRLNCLLLNFSPHCSLAYAKFFQIDSDVQAKCLRNELSVYTDQRMQALGYSNGIITADRGPLVIPRFEGLFAVAPLLEESSPPAYSHVLLLSHIHPLFVSLDTLGHDDDDEIKRHRLQAACHALKQLHDFGYVHGDVSDGNILYSREDTTKVVLLDFEKSRYVTSFLLRVKTHRVSGVTTTRA